MLSRIRVERPHARIEGFSVQQMVYKTGAIELLVGFSEDPVFGPAIVFGHGGTAVEILRDTAIALPPLNMRLARAQMARTRVWQLLQGYRGTPPAALDQIAEALIRVGQLAADHAEIAELDINPLLADANSVIALDARIRVVTTSRSGAARLAIAPYPAELVSREQLRDGSVVDLRPVQPEDEPLLQDLALHMTPEDMRLRFFTPMRGLSHELAARLTQVDYDREMALLAIRGGDALGVAHFFADPDRLRAEYAIALRTDWKGRGLGYALMNRLIEIAREWGIGELVGEVLTENQPMLAMCRELGFATRPGPDDTTVVRVSKPLLPL